MKVKDAIAQINTLYNPDDDILIRWIGPDQVQYAAALRKIEGNPNKIIQGLERNGEFPTTLEETISAIDRVFNGF